MDLLIETTAAMFKSETRARAIALTIQHVAEQNPQSGMLRVVGETASIIIELAAKSAEVMPTAIADMLLRDGENDGEELVALLTDGAIEISAALTELSRMETAGSVYLMQGRLAAWDEACERLADLAAKSGINLKSEEG